MEVSIIGAGLSGVEAANFLADKGIKVKLYEMRPNKTTPAHKTALFAELVCSNSFKSTSIENAHGLLKEEMTHIGSLVIETAKMVSVPAGGALAVDRELFSKRITDIMKKNKNIYVINEEVDSLDKWVGSKEYVIVATGPLTTDKLCGSINNITDKSSLFFYDAAAPIIDGDTIDYDKVFFQSRYDKGGADYLNAPFDKDLYYEFVDEIIKSEKADFHDFENKKIFEGCQPIEVLAERGADTLSFGPMKPVGLTDPKTGKQPYAVVQLRQENINKSMYNMVGFQTRMKWNDQKRIFRMIPGLENAEFFRYGVMHKNTYLNFPVLVNNKIYSLRDHPNIYFAGQITGVEGYIESAASGIFTAYALWAGLNDKSNILFPKYTMMGALQEYTITENKNYQPIASNFGLFDRDVFDEKGRKLKKKDKKRRLAEESVVILSDFIKNNIN